jgi:hypothetical protein
VSDCNTVRLHSAITFITLGDKRAGRAEAIRAARRQKLGQSDARRRAKAEGGATRGRDPSADRGAKSSAGGTMPPLGLPGLAPKR